MVKMASTTVSIVGKIMMISNIAAHYSHPYISAIICWRDLLPLPVGATKSRVDDIVQNHSIIVLPHSTIAIVDEFTRVWTVDYALLAAVIKNYRNGR